MDLRRVLSCCLVAVALVGSLIARERAQAVARNHPPGILYAPGELTAAQRAGGLQFASDAGEADRQRILGAIAKTRPEARTLLDEVDGLVEVHAGPIQPGVIGLATLDGGRLSVRFDSTALAQVGEPTADHVIMHELGHIVDFVLVPDTLLHQLDEGIPRTRSCVASFERTGPCTVPEERFADTFAKWALHSDGPPQWIGYGVEAPLNIETWGQPLQRLAAQYAAARH